MYKIIGLGNPGKEYENTRHNTGRFILQNLVLGRPALPELVQKNKFSPWREDKKTKTLLSSGNISLGIGATKASHPNKTSSKPAAFILPNNFMNNSGKSVAPFVKSKKDLNDLVVIYDDIDLPVGKLKISFGRSSGGHRGLESIIKALKSKNFIRIRVGIAPTTPSGKIKKPAREKDVITFLMSSFKPDEYKKIQKISSQMEEILSVILNEGREKAMTEYNK